MTKLLRKHFINLVNILVAIMILSKASADTYCRGKIPLFLLKSATIAANDL